MQIADPFYYLRNFQTMLETLRRRDQDLLAIEERNFIQRFAGLPTTAQALLVRMVMRKGDLFRGSRLVYAEIADLDAAIRPLVAATWVDERPRLSLEELFRLLPKEALARHLALPRALTALPKFAMLESLRAEFPDDRPFEQWCDSGKEPVYRLSVDALCERLRLMFFGNFRQTLTEFVLADLGVFRFEKIALNDDSRPFSSRAEVEHFLALHRCRELFHAGQDPHAVELALPPPLRGCEWLRDLRDKLRFRIAREQERCGSLRPALAIYSDCSHPEARRRAERLQRQIDGLPRGRPPRPAADPPQFVLTLQKLAVATSVEAAVCVHLEASADEDTRVYHVENRLINSLFGLLCWRAIFAPVRGAFFHGFHHAPADLSSVGFHGRRLREFTDCLAELCGGSYKDTIRRCFVEKSGITSPFVAWGSLDERLLEMALQCFPAGHLAHWFDWILRDVTRNRAGFPDLVQFWPSSRRYRLIEIKGPGDRLQDNQRRCLDHCLTADLPVSVCHVRWLTAVAEST